MDVACKYLKAHLSLTLIEPVYDTCS